MLLDRTHVKWLWITAAALVVATAIYIPYHLRTPKGPSGGSWWGLAYGVVGFGLMVFAGLLGARKKVPVWRVGRAQSWMRGHLWLGLLAFPLIVFHSGFSLGGPLTTLLMVLFGLVVLSGIFGAVVQHYLARRMTREVAMETIYDEIDHVREQLREEADQLVHQVCGDWERPETPRRAPANPRGRPAAAALIEVEDEIRNLFRDQYLERIRPFLEQPQAKTHLLAHPERASDLFDHLRTLLPPAVHEVLADLEDICEEERQLTRQAQLHGWLHGWLIVHVPLSYVLLLLGAIHAVMALRF